MIPFERPGADDPLGREIREFAVRLRLAERARELDLAPAFPRDEFRELGRAGLLGLHWGPEFGGRGIPLRRVGAALFQLAFAGGTAFAKLSLQPEFSGVLAEHGSPELVDRYFRPLMRGEVLVGNQITEPSAGSDAAAIGLEAVRDADEYILSGTKSEAAFAQDADVALVYARSSPRTKTDAGVTVLLVEQDRPGIERRCVPDLGERWMRRGVVTYEKVRVPVDHRIGAEGAALGYVREELTRERALLAAIYLGVARSSWEETVERVGQRTAFGKPLSAQQAVAFPLVEDWARQEAAWGLVDRTLGRLETGGKAHAEAALAKWMSTEVALSVIDHAIQFHGGAGYSQSLPHERRWRDVRSGGIAHGPSEIMHLVAARTLWPRPD